jgi:hypothetical protein
MVLRKAVVVLAAALCPVSTGCTDSSATGNSLVTVNGVVRLYGGPAVLMRGQAKTALTGASGVGQRVTARAAGGAVASVTAGSDGRVVLRLRPGTYEFGPCAPAERIEIGPGKKQQLVLRCYVP